MNDYPTFDDARARAVLDYMRRKDALVERVRRDSSEAAARARRLVFGPENDAPNREQS